MSEEALELLAKYEALPAKEQEEIVAAIAFPKNLGETSADNLASTDEWIASFERWADSHESRNPSVDCSRESIYEGRGE